MRTMYDAVNATNIPKDATMVAGYLDTIAIPQWTPADWNRFPSALKLGIVKKATSNFGNVLDVEKGDATPAEAPGWVTRRRLAGYAYPIVYCNLSTWPAVRAAFTSQHVTPPLYWIAKYDNVASIPADWAALDCIGKQYKNTPGYDLSIMNDYIPGIEAENDVIDPADINNIKTANWYTALWTITNADGTKSTPSASNVLSMLHDQLTSLTASVAAQTAIIDTLLKGNNLSADQVKTIVTEAVQQSMHITGTLEISGD